MLDARSRQPSFFDTDQICQPLFPPDSFWHRFRTLVYPLINDEDYACMYCPDRGLAKVNLQCLFTALVVNIKRWFNLIRARAPALSPA